MPFQSIDEILEAKGTSGLFDYLLEKFAIHSGLSGVQPKVMIRGQENADLRQSPSFKSATHIVKFWDAAEYPELAAKGMKNTGTENYGGPIVTAGGLLFIGATSFDKKFRAFDKSTGELLWETTLSFAGNATPATYQVNGRQYVVIAAGGGKDPKSPSGGVYLAFALPK